MNKQLFRREQTINMILATIEEVVRNEKEINEKDLVLEIMVKTSVTKRTAREYFEVAKAKFDRKNKGN